MYVEMWTQTVAVQQHFNDIEWRIRGLALTAATFSVGAAGLAVNTGHALPGAVILGVGLVLWYAFYFVDRYWYHPLLVAAVVQGHLVEDKIEGIGLAGVSLTKSISAGSPIERPTMIKLFTRKKNKEEKLRSEGKLVWFYRIGAMALGTAMAGFFVAAIYGHFYNGYVVANSTTTQVPLATTVSSTSTVSATVSSDAPSLPGRRSTAEQNSSSSTPPVVSAPAVPR